MPKSLKKKGVVIPTAHTVYHPAPKQNRTTSNILYNACTVASDIIATVKLITVTGTLLDKEQRENLKLASDILATVRKLNIEQAKARTPQSVTHNNQLTMSSEELKQLLKATQSFESSVAHEED